MKILCSSTFLILIIAVHFSCSSQKLYTKVELSEIKMLNPKMDSLLNVVIEDVGKRLNSFDFYCLLDAIKQGDDYNIHISIAGKVAFDYDFHSENFTTQGFCKIGNHDVLVINEFYPNIMEYLNTKKTYTFFNIREKYKKEKIPPPPPMSNPIIFDFLLKENGNVILLKK